ncbi:MAG: TRAP transporter substrate-binding protein DctP [Thermovirgaceae bacterium]|jgi:TRAP-type C4-dicarboxylate transport system substrate-binding protein|nr:TRAP transporter substrate-binding protein DctP [Synergistales bacterium]MDI9391686.1 TRAP transporter substrate-binding protein DctP [Synergistota bacterium]MDY0179009.1 TRAP transporter substrate-binding protein DctP [Synergistaceae bacterium]HRW86933.1 TRAP transporter substrate-binding protein DctP [Thermovirgaceae bacterium]MDD3829885.1 TRAP transporter substrate-binding protein DctP [Synergistales bacterium]
MRKILALVLVAVLVLSLGAAATAAPKWTFKMGHPNPVDVPYDKTAHKFADLVSEKTNGQVKINIFPNNQLGDWTETFELISRGVVEMGFQIANAQYDPKLNFAYYMPYVVSDIEEAKKAYAPGGWAFGIIKDLWLEHGIQPLAVYPIGMAGVSLRSMPPAPGDPNVPKNMKVRVMPLAACSMTYEALGYIATPIPYAEVYSGIQTGIVDGQQGGPPFQAWSFRDVNKVWIQYNDYFEQHWITINKGVWDKLPADVQAALQEAANEASAIRWDQVETEDADYRKVLKEEFGWDIVMLTDEELKACADKVRREVWPKMKDLLGEDLYTEVRLNSMVE